MIVRHRWVISAITPIFSRANGFPVSSSGRGHRVGCRDAVWVERARGTAVPLRTLAFLSADETRVGAHVPPFSAPPAKRAACFLCHDVVIRVSHSQGVWPLTGRRLFSDGNSSGT